MSPVPGEETMIDASELLPDDPGERDGPAPGTGGDSPILGLFRRRIDAMQWRMDALQPDSEPSPLEVFEALESTMEELRVAVEELRQTNQALLDSRAEVEAEQRRYRDLFDLAPDAYLVTDLRGVIREANQAASTLFNIDTFGADFLIGKPLFVFLPEEGRTAFRSEISRLRDQAGIAEYDLRLLPRKLPPFDATIRVGVVRDAWGRPAGLRWTIRDISPRKRAEEKIRALNHQLERQVAERSEQLESVLQTNERWLIKAHAADADEAPGGQFFRDIVEEVDAILWQADAATGRYTFISRRAEELLGYPASRWLDDPDFWLGSIHAEDRDFVDAYRRKQLREGVDHEAEYRVVAADGRTLWFREAVRVPRRGPDGPAVLYGLMVNISKRKKVERQLYTAKGELASQLRDMTYLLELRGRLADARGLAATLDEVLSGVVSLQGAEMATLWLHDPGRDTMPLATWHGLPEEFARRIEGVDLASRLDPIEPLSIEDVEAEPEGSPWRLAGRFGGFRAVAVVPMSTRDGDLLGAIIAGFKGPYRMGDRQARLVEMYAGHAAGAIEAARDFERLEESDRRKDEAIAAMKATFAEILAGTLDPIEAREAIERQLARLERLADDHINA